MLNTLGYLLSSARISKKKSQEYMALELGVARKTINNWETDVTSPSIDQAINYFKVLGLSPVPSIFKYVFPNMEEMDEESRYKQELKNLIDSMPLDLTKQLLNMFYGEHGSSPRALMQLISAHLETPMKDRISNAALIIKNYELAIMSDKCLNQSYVDLALLKKALSEAEKSFVSGNSGYAMDRGELPAN